MNMQVFSRVFSSFLTAETLPAWAAVVAAAAAVWVARSSIKFSQGIANANLVREISDIENQTLLLAQTLKSKMYFEKLRINNSLASAGYDSTYIGETLESIFSSKDEERLSKLISDLGQSTKTHMAGRSYNDLMNEWIEASRLRTEYTQIQAENSLVMKQIESILINGHLKESELK